MTERYVNNDPEQGVDPDTLCDNGIVQIIAKATLKELKEEIERQYGKFEHYEGNRYETSFEEMQYGIVYSNMVNIYIYEVETKETKFK